MKRYVEPPTPPKASCAACRTFVPVVWVPSGADGAIALCWLCAHAVERHAHNLYTAPTAECECLPHEIYPDRIAAPQVALDTAIGSAPNTQATECVKTDTDGIDRVVLVDSDRPLSGTQTGRNASAARRRERATRTALRKIIPNFRR